MVGNNTIKRTPLLPDRHPIQDFFICDVTDAIPKDDMGRWSIPFTRWPPKPDLAVREYVSVAVRNSAIIAAQLSHRHRSQRVVWGASVSADLTFREAVE